MQHDHILPAVIHCITRLYHLSELGKQGGDAEFVHHPSFAPCLTCNDSLHHLMPL